MISDSILTQSPIDINIDKTIKLRPPVQLCFPNYFTKRDLNPKVINNGHTAKIFLPDLVKPPMIKCGPLRDEYAFEYMLFRWGDLDNNGSEHAINGKRFVGEAQLVHYNTKYGSFDVALEKKDGLLALAVLLELSEQHNSRFNTLLDALRRVSCRSKEYTYTTRAFLEWLEDANLREYVTYAGSLTCRPYSENVRWIVLTNTLPISKKQMGVFRGVHIYHGKYIIKNNTRELHTPPEGHEIHYSGKYIPKIKR